MALGGTDLLFDQIEVIEQPFAGRRDLLIRFYRRCEPAADADQDRFIRRQTRQKLLPQCYLRQLVHGRETLAMLFHLTGAEQLRAQRGLIKGAPEGNADVAQARPQLVQIMGKTNVTCLHFISATKNSVAQHRPIAAQTDVRLADVKPIVICVCRI